MPAPVTASRRWLDPATKGVVLPVTPPAYANTLGCSAPGEAATVASSRELALTIQPLSPVALPCPRGQTRAPLAPHKMNFAKESRLLLASCSASAAYSGVHSPGRCNRSPFVLHWPKLPCFSRWPHPRPVQIATLRTRARGCCDAVFFSGSAPVAAARFSNSRQSQASCPDRLTCIPSAMGQLALSNPQRPPLPGSLRAICTHRRRARAV